MTFIERTEREFGEPFADVLQGFAAMGYGCATTARMLEYDVRNFRRLLERKGITIDWPSAGERIDAYDRNSMPGCQRMIAARRTLAPLHANPTTGERLTASQWAECLGISCTQFLRRLKQYGNQRRVFLPNLRSAA